MRVSTFRKHLSATGTHGTVRAEVVTTMNYETKKINGTHFSTHEDFASNIRLHKVEVFIDGVIWQGTDKLNTESAVLKESERWIKEAANHIVKLSKEKPKKGFSEKMNELFS